MAPLNDILGPFQPSSKPDLGGGFSSAASTMIVPPVINPKDHPVASKLLTAINPLPESRPMAFPIAPSVPAVIPPPGLAPGPRRMVPSATQAALAKPEVDLRSPVRKLLDSLNPLSSEAQEKTTLAFAPIAAQNRYPEVRRVAGEAIAGMVQPGGEGGEAEAFGEATGLRGVGNEIKGEIGGAFNKLMGKEAPTAAEQIAHLPTPARQSWGEVEKLAQNANTPVESLLQHPANTKDSAQMISSLNDYSNTLNKEITKLRSSTDPREVAQMNGLILKRQAALNAIDAAGTNHARALAIFNKQASQTMDLSYWLRQGQKTAGRDLTPIESKAIEDAIQNNNRKALVNQVADLNHSSFTDKLVNLWKTGLLSSPSTLLKKTLGDTMMQGLETLKDIPAAGADKLASLFTGKRTVTPNIKGSLAGFKNMGKAEQTLAERSGEALPVPNRTNYASGVENLPAVLQGPAKAASKVLQKYSGLVHGGYTGVTDTFALNAMERSFNQQAKVEAMNRGLKGAEADTLIQKLVKNPTKTMQEQAVKDAGTATFQRETPISMSVKGAKKGLANSGGAAGQIAGEATLPFVKTPAAIATSLYDYSPFSIPGSLAKLYGGDQRAFAQGIGRSVVGTGLVGLGALGAKAGLVSGAKETVAANRFPNEIENRLPSSVNVGGQQIQTSQLGVPGGTMTMGAALQQGIEQKQSPVELLKTLGVAGLTTVANMSGLKGLQPLMEAFTNPERSVNSVIGNLAGSIEPNILKKLTAPPSSPQTFVEPGAAKTTSETWPQTVLREGLNTFSPVQTAQLHVTPESQKIRELHDAGFPVTPGMVTKTQTIGGVHFPLDDKTFNLVKRAAGGEQSKFLTQAINSPTFMAMDQMMQSKYLEKNFNDIYDKVRFQVLAPQLAKTFVDLRAKAAGGSAADIKALKTFEKSGIFKNLSVQQAIGPAAK